MRKWNHGTLYGYNYGHCRCTPCRRAMSRHRAGYEHDLNNGRPRIVDGTGTRRRLQALAADGWSWTEIGARYGCSGAAVPRHARQRTVTAVVAGRVQLVYAKLAGNMPPRSTPAEKRAANVQQRKAAEQGWLPTIAWDEETMDDPRAVPYAELRVHELDPVILWRMLDGDLDAGAALRHGYGRLVERVQLAAAWEAEGRLLSELEAAGWNPHRDRRKLAELQAVA